MTGSDTHPFVDQYRRAYPSFARATELLRVQLEDLLKMLEVDYLEISSRPKPIDSLEEKVTIRKPESYGELKDVTDLCGACIVVYFEDDIEPLITMLSDNLVGVDRDDSINKLEITDPNRFGYKAWHLNFQITENIKSIAPDDVNYLEGFKGEIQVRTAFMHAWAKIEHRYNYKASKGSLEVKRRFARLASLVDLADSELCAIHSWFKSNEPDIIDASSVNALIGSEELQAILRPLKASQGIPLFGASEEELERSSKLLLSAGFSGIGAVREQLSRRQHKLVTALDKFSKSSSRQIRPATALEFAAFDEQYATLGLPGVIEAASHTFTFEGDFEILDFCREIVSALSDQN
ncbi:MAG: hypothetical protein WA056_10445 [Gallionella sp.]